MNDTAYDDEEPPSSPGGLPVEPMRIVQGVLAHWIWLPIAAIVAGGLGLAYALVKIKPTYETESVLIYEPAGRSDELSTLIGMFTLPGPLARTKAELDFKGPTKALRHSIEVWFDKKSNLVTVVGKGGTGEDAAELVNTLVDVVLNDQTQLDRTRATETASAVVTELETTKKTLEELRDKYAAFRREHGVIDFSTEYSEAQRAVATLKRDRDAAVAQVQALKAQAATLGKLARSRPKMQVQSATRSNPNAAQLRQLKAQLASDSARLSPEHPRIAQLKAQIASLEASSASADDIVSDVVSTTNPEVAALRSELSGVQTSLAASEQSVKTLTAALDEAEAKLTALSAIEPEASKFLKSIGFHEARLEKLQTQLNSAEESGRSAVPEFRVLSRAAVPPYPEASGRKKIVVGATFGAVFAVLMVLILVALRDGKILSPREAAFWSGLPVIASSTWPREEGVFRRFVDELNDHAARTTGATLLLSASPSSIGLATQLADALGPMPPAGYAPAAEAVDVQTHDASREEPEDAVIVGASGRSQVPASGAALMTVSAQPGPLAHPIPGQPPASFHAGRGGLRGPDLRRACRLADRVVVLVNSGESVFTRLMKLRTELGRDQGVALVVVGIPDTMVELPDRVGDVDAFWGVR